jgi:hypothetical protein
MAKKKGKTGNKKAAKATKARCDIKKISIAIGAIAAVALGVCAFFLWPRALKVGFLDVDPALSASLGTVLSDWSAREGISVKVVTVREGVPDAKSLRGVDALFLYPSRPNKASAGLFVEVDKGLSSLMPLSLVRSIDGPVGSWAVPALVDTSELAWKKSVLPADRSGFPSGSGSIDSLLARKKRNDSDMLAVSGGDDGLLLDFTGLLVLEKGGLSAYEKLAAYLLSGEGSGESALDYDLGGTTLKTVLSGVSGYAKSGVIHPNWLDFKTGDTIACVDSSVAAFAVQTLFMHRQEKRESLSDWSSFPFIASDGKGTAVVSASVLSLALPKSGRLAQEGSRLASWLASAEGQRVLQASTGLAPAVSAVQASDGQANDARAAVGSAVVVQGLARDGFATAKGRTEFAATLRVYIRAFF